LSETFEGTAHGECVKATRGTRGLRGLQRGFPRVGDMGVHMGG